MNVSNCSLIVIICFASLGDLDTEICRDYEIERIEVDANTKITCRPNKNLKMIYNWRNIRYYGLNSNASLGVTHIPKKFHKDASVTFEDLKIEHAYPTINVKKLSLRNVHFIYRGKAFLDRHYTHRLTALNIENSYFTDQKDLQLKDLQHLFLIQNGNLNVSISNSIFSQFSKHSIFLFDGSKKNGNTIIFRNNSVTNNKNIYSIMTVKNSALFLVNNKINFNVNLITFLYAINSSILFSNNTVSMNLKFVQFIRSISNDPITINFADNHIKLNYIRIFLKVKGKMAQITMKRNMFFKNEFDYVLYDSSSSKKRYYTLENEEYYLNNFTLLRFKNFSAELKISHSTFVFGGFIHTTCPVIDAKLFNKIKMIHSNLTTCESSIQKAIQFQCGDKHAIQLVDCQINKCHKRPADIDALVVTVLAIIIGWILMPYLPVKKRKIFSWKKYFDKSTQTELQGDNESIYDTID